MSLFDDILPQNKSNPPAGGNPPVQNDPLAPAPQIIITESVPMNILAPMGENPPIETTPDTPTPVAPVSPDESSIIIVNENDTIPVVPISPVSVSPVSEVPVSPVSVTSDISAVTTEIPPNNTPANSGLFSLVSDTPVSEVPVSPVSEVSNTADLTNITTDIPHTPPTFQTTEDLIAHEISDLDEFILSLDEVDRAKLEQEAEYKKQKEHFAELEIQAESEHQKVLTERSHAEKMKAYLEEEIQGSHTEKVVTKKSSKSLV